MSDALLIFTFSPVQPFIAEARRTSDLFAGSRILSDLAEAAAAAIQQGHGRLVYPAVVAGGISDKYGMPNKIVARVPAEQVELTANSAREALLARWLDVAKGARGRLEELEPPPDGEWQRIWDRQVSRIWEVYWAAAALEGRSYPDAYRLASRALDAAKRTRCFDQSEEKGPKDSLSGRREALRTAECHAREYWHRIGQQVGPSKLRPEGRERLDAIGAVKRFVKRLSELADGQFLSTSSIASNEFLERAREGAGVDLEEYRKAVQKLLSKALYSVRPDADWPYDGDLFYRETLNPNRLRDSYGVTQVDQEVRAQTCQALTHLHEVAGGRPSPYYAIIALDGDGMGEQVEKFLAAADPEGEHRGFSERLSAFAGRVRDVVEENLGVVVYNGGDDVVGLAPLVTALPLARKLAEMFRAETGATASVGIAVVHHLYPLDAALRAARDAERGAKDVHGKNAVCVRVLKRSGETTEVRSSWPAMGDTFEKMVRHFETAALSSRLAFDVAYEASVVTCLDDRRARSAMLKRLLGRHRAESPKVGPPVDIADLVACLRNWADALDDCVPAERVDSTAVPQGLAELGAWLLLARFVAQGGQE